MVRALLFLAVLAACGRPPRPLAPASAPAGRPARCPPAPDDDVLVIEPALTTLGGEPIAHIEVRGIDRAVLGDGLTTKAGEPLDVERVRADASWIRSVGVASQIEARAERRDDGLALIYDLAPQPRVARVVIEGADPALVPALTALEDTLRDPARAVRIGEVAQRVLQMEGYLRAQVTTETRVACHDAEVHATVALGPRYRIGRIDVTGSAIPIAMTRFERELGAANRVGGWFRSDLLVPELQLVVQNHVDQGWLKAQIDPPDLQVDEARQLVSIAANVRPGPRYRIGELRIEGGTAGSRARAESTLRPLHGQFFAQRTYQRAIHQLSRQLDARVALEAQWQARPDADIVDVTLTMRAR